MRKTIARRLSESKQTIPHFYVSVDVTLDQLLALRERLNAQAPKDADGKPAWKISVNDFVIKAMAMALAKVPDANVSWTENAMVKHKHADIGVAVSIPGGLITPIVRQAETKGLAQISAEMKDYAKRAKDRKLKPEEYSGGSAAISNMGMLNVKSFGAIVNPPHASILAVGSGEERAVVRKRTGCRRAADDHHAFHRSPLHRRRLGGRVHQCHQGLSGRTGIDAGVTAGIGHSRCSPHGLAMPCSGNGA
jgi:pyruvate dehydrogenase E2 component (dihydrolipoamide acetyltransferase)